MDFAEATIKTYSGFSTEIKPTIAGGTDVPNGSRWREVDTEKTYHFNLANDTWYFEGPELDQISHARVGVSFPHHKTHEEDHYFFKSYIVDIGGTGSTTLFSFTTPNTAKRIHAKASLTPDVDFTVNIQEDAVVSGGVSLDGFNNDRDSTNVAELEAVGGPTLSIVTPGVIIWPARSGGGKNPIGVSPGFNYEIMAKTNTVYVFEIIKNVPQQGIVDIDFWWYEHAPKP